MKPIDSFGCVGLHLNFDFFKEIKLQFLGKKHNWF